MATRRTSASSRASSGGGVAAGFGKVLLYVLATVGGLYLGAQAWAKLAPPEKPGGKTDVSHNSAPPPEHVAAPSSTGRRHSRHTEETSEKPEENTETAETPKSDPTTEAPKPGGSEEKYPGVEIDRASTGRPEICLTLDAGADWKPASKILDTLQSEGVKTTFFLTGEWVKQNPRTTKRIADEGHEIGNHSWSHPDFTQLSESDIADQLDRTEAIVQGTTGKTSKPYFRPPLGARDDRVRRTVGENGYLSIYWTLDSHDSVQKGITAEEITDRVLKNAQPGSIVLLHCGSQATADALPGILAGLKERRLKPVMLSQLLTK